MSTSGGTEGGGIVVSVEAGAGIAVDATDPTAPIVSLDLDDATASHTATTAFGALTVDTPKQNTLGYSILVSGTIGVTAATAGSLKLGVGSSATPTTDPIVEDLTVAALTLVAFSAIVPDTYYLSLQHNGTITLDSPVIVCTAI